MQNTIIKQIEQERKFFATGSGSPIALGVLEDNFREGLSADEGVKLALRAIKAAAERDIATGGMGLHIASLPVNVSTFTIDSSYTGHSLLSFESSKYMLWSPYTKTPMTLQEMVRFFWQTQFISALTNMYQRF
jgi:hypothetical protein